MKSYTETKFVGTNDFIKIIFNKQIVNIVTTIFLMYIYYC